MIGSPQRWWLAAGALVVVAVAAFVLWRTLAPRESTDDAQVSGHVSAIAARVTGAVLSVPVHENQQVKAGDVLVEIDRRDYRVALDRAQADLAAAEAALGAANTSVPLTRTTATSELSSATASAAGAEAGVRAADREAEAAAARVASADARLVEAKAVAVRTAQDLDRMKQLIAKDEISKQQFDAAVAAADAARAAADSAQASVKEAQANAAVVETRRAQSQDLLSQARAHARSAGTAPQQIALTEARAAGAEAQVQQARTAVEQARLNLDRATIHAPVDGIIGRKSVEVGQLVQPGQALLALVSLSDTWVTANFKETQLDRMRAGQTVVVSIDAYGGRAYRGHVDSIAAATGSTFSLLPSENASGNFVKVVQRVPVKIVIDSGQDADHQLRPGMSAVATVYIR
jgi:membrane fusion protein (multidrug efflux system)